MSRLTPKLLFHATITFLLMVLLFTACTAPAPQPAPAAAVGRYLMMDPPADSDKQFPVNSCDYSCWMHTAANMLAAAGYGNGNTVEDRAGDIWNDMAAHFPPDTNCTAFWAAGWTPTAVNWWLQSSHNTWSATNPYTLVTVYGSAQRIPWTNANGAMALANHLRAFEPTGLSISWPTTNAVGEGGHAITSWGDGVTGNQALTTNTTDVIVTDSDRDSADNTHTYNYDAFNAPNPGGASQGNGWYLNYSNNHPFIKAIHVLSAPGPTLNAVRVLGSYRVQQTAETPATDLHFRVATDTEIVSYRTWTDRADQNIRNIDLAMDRKSILVDIDFAEGVPQGTWVTISTEFVLSRWNQMRYEDVRFSYPDDAMESDMPAIEWNVDTPIIMDTNKTALNAIGGYLVVGFKLVDPKSDATAAEYRLAHQYLYDQDPGMHTLSLAGSPEFLVRGIRWGHSYGLPSEEDIWKFDEFWLGGDDRPYALKDGPVVVEIRLDLPYPEGDGPIPSDVLTGNQP